MWLFSSIISVIFSDQKKIIKTQPLSLQFSRIWDFHEWYAIVKNIEWDRYNFVNKNGTLLSKEWFSRIENFNNWYAKIGIIWKWSDIFIQSKEWWNFISNNWDYLFNERLDSIESFEIKTPLASFRLDSYKIFKFKKWWNIIDINKKIISNEWFSNIERLSDGYVGVKIDWKWRSFIDMNWKYLSKTRFNHIDKFNDWYAIVKHKTKWWNFINKKGKYLSHKWFKLARPFNDWYAKVILEWKELYINGAGKMASNIDNLPIILIEKEQINIDDEKVHKNNQWNNEIKKKEHLNDHYNEDFFTTYQSNLLWEQLKQKVFDLKGRICSECDDTTHLDVHHVLPRHMWWKDEIDNLIVLCRDCHEDIHGYEIGTGEYQWKPISKKLQLIHKALEDKEDIMIIYKDENGKITERTITPESLYYENKMQYLKSYCHLRNLPRVFRIARIQKII